MAADLVFVLSTCSTSDPVSGLRVRLSAGEAWWASDPFVKARPELFTDRPQVVRGSRGVKTAAAPVEVEQATAVPGVKRAVKRASEK